MGFSGRSLLYVAALALVGAIRPALEAVLQVIAYAVVLLLIAASYLYARFVSRVGALLGRGPLR